MQQPKKKRERVGRITVDMGTALAQRLKDAAETTGCFLKTLVIRAVRKFLDEMGKD